MCVCGFVLLLSPPIGALEGREGMGMFAPVETTEALPDPKKQRERERKREQRLSER